MGYADEVKLGRKDRKKALSQGAKRRVGRTDSGQADWSSANAGLIARAIAQVGKCGGALRFGYTSDGGAYAVGIYGDGDKPYTDYVRPDENIDEYLLALIDLWE